jgi:predicted P-loop ATPase
MQISYWKKVNETKTELERGSIDDFISRVKNGYWRETIQQVRIEQDKQKRDDLKKLLPAVTISGVFNERSQSKLEKHSGFICVDIDYFTDKSLLKDDPYTYACFNSVSGKGIAVIVKIDPTKHKESYRWLSEYYFNLFGIEVDPAPSNVASARFVSFDPEIIVNAKSKKAKTKVEKIKKANTLALIIPKTDISELLNQVQSNVLENYEDWRNFGFSCAKGFGEDGRNYFHKMSMFSNKYEFDICNHSYNVFLKSKSQGITVGTFYYYLKQGGADLTKYNSDDKIKEIALNKRLNLSKAESINLLINDKNLTELEAKDIVDEIYERSDIDIRNSGGTENIIINVSNYIHKTAVIKKNLITRKYEINNEQMEDKHFNSLYLKARMTFDDNAVTFDLCQRIIMSEGTIEYNPIQLYIEANKWRNTTGNVEAICNSIESKTHIKNRFIKKWLLSIIACYSGFPARSVLCLTGGQNTGKTEFFRRLLPSALQCYYAESNMDKGKDDELLMCEKLIVMDDEMGGKSKQDEKRFKELTSKNFFSLRAAYGRHNEDFKRLALLGGTTNEKAVINDPTGNTRILPVEVISINHELYNSIDKDELFMELYRLYTSGEEWQLNKDEISVLKEVSGEFETIPFERELILKFFDIPTNGAGSMMTATDIKEVIECNSKQKILSLKKLGTELKNLFGDSVSTRQGYKYKVQEKYGNSNQIQSAPWMD